MQRSIGCQYEDCSSMPEVPFRASDHDGLPHAPCLKCTNLSYSSGLSFLIVSRKAPACGWPKSDRSSSVGSARRPERRHIAASLQRRARAAASRPRNRAVDRPLERMVAARAEIRVRRSGPTSSGGRQKALSTSSRIKSSSGSPRAALLASTRTANAALLASRAHGPSRPNVRLMVGRSLFPCCCSQTTRRRRGFAPAS